MYFNLTLPQTCKQSSDTHLDTVSKMSVGKSWDQKDKEFNLQTLGDPNLKVATLVLGGEVYHIRTELFLRLTSKICPSFLSFSHYTGVFLSLLLPKRGYVTVLSMHVCIEP